MHPSSRKRASTDDSANDWMQMILAYDAKQDMFGIINEICTLSYRIHFPKSLESFKCCIFVCIKPPNPPGDVFRGLDPDRDPWRTFFC